MDDKLKQQWFWYNTWVPPSDKNTHKVGYKNPLCRKKGRRAQVVESVPITRTFKRELKVKC